MTRAGDKPSGAETGWAIHVGGARTDAILGVGGFVADLGVIVHGE